MGPEGSLPHSQVLATCPYPEPAQSSSHTPTSKFLKIHINIIFSSTPRSPQWSPSLRFRDQNPVHAFPPNTRYMTHPSHSSRLCNPHTIRWGVQIIKLLIMQFTPLPCYLVPLRPKYSPQHPILKNPQPTFLLQYERRKKLTVLLIYIVHWLV